MLTPYSKKKHESTFFGCAIIVTLSENHAEDGQVDCTNCECTFLDLVELEDQIKVLYTVRLGQESMVCNKPILAGLVTVIDLYRF